MAQAFTADMADPAQRQAFGALLDGLSAPRNQSDAFRQAKGIHRAGLLSATKSQADRADLQRRFDWEDASFLEDRLGGEQRALINGIARERWPHLYASALPDDAFTRLSRRATSPIDGRTFNYAGAR